MSETGGGKGAGERGGGPLLFAFENRCKRECGIFKAETLPQIPSKDQVIGLSEDLRARSKLPQHVLKVLDALPQGTHPMTQLSTAVMSLQVNLSQDESWACPYDFRGQTPHQLLCCKDKLLPTTYTLLQASCLLQPESKFAAAYTKGIRKTEFWDPIYEDSLDLIAKMPGIAANIYRRTYKGGDQIPADLNLDWAGNLAHQMGEAYYDFNLYSKKTKWETSLIFSIYSAIIKVAQWQSQSSIAMQALRKKEHRN